MTKKEIIEFIKNKNIINNSKILPLYNHCSSNTKYEKLFTQLLNSHNDLFKQYENEKKALQEYNKFLQDNKCNHEIRTKVIDDDEKYWLDIEPTYCYQCIFCKHKIPANKENADWFQKHFYNNCIYLENNNTDIFNIILELLNDKQDDEKIDFVKEFKKLNLENCIINDEKRPENYVMLIYDYNMLSRDAREYSQELIFLSYLSKLQNIRFQLITHTLDRHRLESLSWYANFPKDSYNFKNNLGFPQDIKFSYPEDLYAEDGDLIRVLDKDKKEKIDFKLIINWSPSIEKTVDLNNGEKIVINDELQKKFPSSTIINIDKLDQKIIEELSSYIDVTFNGQLIDTNDYENVKRLIKE